MQNGVKKKAVYCLLALVVFLMGAGKGDPVRNERTALRAERRELLQKIEKLKHEEDYLLFQKTMYENDSKYLVIDIREKTGRLKYRNRVLKDFRFKTSENFPVRSLKPGMLTLTEKIEGKKDRHALVFGKSFTVRWKQSTIPKQQASVPSLTLARKDLLSVYFAVENGALAYVVR
ncbi:MAG TPA: hypothetical protein VF888_01255 [Nitrospirota bacterium]